MADVTNIDTRLNGILTETAYTDQETHVFDFTEQTAIAAVGTHNLFKLPKGEAVLKARLVVIGAGTSGGSATVQLKLSFNGVAAAINSSAIAVADLTAGSVHQYDITAIKGYDASYEGIVQLTIGTAAMTGGKFAVIVDTVPLKRFLENG